MYEGLKSDCESDPTLIKDLHAAKKLLKTFYWKNYANKSRSLPLQPSPSTSSISSGNGSSNSPQSPEKVNFTLRYQKRDRVVIDELEEFFKLPQEDFNSYRPLQWWLGWCSQFPNLYCLVCDVLSIPGRFCCMINYSLTHVLY